MSGVGRRGMVWWQSLRSSRSSVSLIPLGDHSLYKLTASCKSGSIHFSTVSMNIGGQGWRAGTLEEVGGALVGASPVWRHVHYITAPLPLGYTGRGGESVKIGACPLQTVESIGVRSGEYGGYITQCTGVRP